MRIAGKHMKKTALQSNMCEILSINKSDLIRESMWVFLRLDVFYLILRPATKQHLRFFFCILKPNIELRFQFWTIHDFINFLRSVFSIIFNIHLSS